MTTTEFSNEFDILYNNIMSNAAPGLNEYEKSVFLTKAQYEIVKSYFSPKGNKFNEGFDDSSKRQIDFSKVTCYIELTKLASDKVSGNPFNNKSTRFSFPTDAMMILNESLRVTRDEKDIFLTVIPISFEEYARQMSKPYKYPVKNQAWRLITTTNNEDPKARFRHVEIIAGPNDNMETAKYFVRYLKRPDPIILDNLPSDLTIDGEYRKTECELDGEIHHEILQRAVELAKAVYTGDLSSQIALGQQSETNMGNVVQSR